MKNDESQASFSDLADERFLIGDPEEVAESIRQYERELDVDHLALRVHWPGMEHHKTIECI
jgi:alkanesulfonate monooxygenase SsuD/methylene tetrahydromethanopterin reductase-like flavin-dependent oxidoreductase (luciferase family)